MKRYSIQFCLLRHQLQNKESAWATIQRKRTEKSARKNWWKWVNSEMSEPSLYRIWDNKENKVVEL